MKSYCHTAGNLNRIKKLVWDSADAYRKSNNRGIDGDWGAHGLWKEIFNLELVTISVGVGVLITLILMLAIYFSRE